MSLSDRSRLFVGIGISEQDRNTIITGRSNVIAPGSGARLTDEDQLHLTVLFIGDRDPNLVQNMQDRIAHIASGTPPMTVINGKFRSMPKHDPHMMWVRFQPLPALTLLHNTLAQNLGAPPSVYVPYWPHITVARKVGPLAEIHQQETIIKTLRIDHLTLFLSHRFAGGAKHSVVQTWSLSGTDPIAQKVVV